MPEIITYPDRMTLAHAAAEHIIETASRALLDSGRCSIALAGGSTPRDAYRLLPGVPLDWNNIHFFWGDERCVPPDHVDSNYRMARLAFLDVLDIPSKNIHRVRGERPPDAAAQAYRQELARYFSGSLPVFDLVLLGLGDDGHTASLFPGSSVLAEEKLWAAPVEHKAPPLPLVDRVTLTFPVINAARQVTFLVSGVGKMGRLSQVRSALEIGQEPLPAQRVQPHSGGLLWMVDQAAGGDLGG